MVSHGPDAALDIPFPPLLSHTRPAAPKRDPVLHEPSHATPLHPLCGKWRACGGRDIAGLAHLHILCYCVPLRYPGLPGQGEGAGSPLVALDSFPPLDPLLPASILQEPPSSTEGQQGGRLSSQDFPPLVCLNAPPPSQAQVGKAWRQTRRRRGRSHMTARGARY